MIFPSERDQKVRDRKKIGLFIRELPKQIELEKGRRKHSEFKILTSAAKMR